MPRSLVLSGGGRYAAAAHQAAQAGLRAALDRGVSVLGRPTSRPTRTGTRSWPGCPRST
ncbi:MAG TPA: hypothetical protein VGI00_01625 [Streptosporangiaceae bacterium]|jgi:hypothetical protein